ncbi:MAG: RHS repeat-associated core domain-containing protein, partial [Candidatus Omnitrophica bacterium]|nr:RHS repeat-associated core domain-containing protein [Candidatus Omnitrophota bacterium]
MGSRIDEPLTMTRSSTTYYYLMDGLGSVRQLTNSSGTIVESYDYDPYGGTTIYDSSLTDITSTGSGIDNPYMFTGRRFDEETGIYYYRNRQYDPAIGRFLQRDPLGYYDSMNLYEYVGSNPVNSVDPLGLQTVTEYGTIISLIIMGAIVVEELINQLVVSYRNEMIQEGDECRVPVFRAVREEEYIQIMSTQTFINPIGVEVKYFTFTYEEAVEEGGRLDDAFHDGPYSVVGSTFPGKDIRPDMIVPPGTDRLPNGGIVIYTEDLPKLSPPIDYGPIN